MDYVPDLHNPLKQQEEEKWGISRECMAGCRAK